MNNHPLVSIVIPCYNTEKTLEKTLESIFNQTYNNYEIIGVNDGSTDGTLNILHIYKYKIKIINQENRGAAAARNRGFKETKGQYLLFCDADVILKPTMLEKMTNTLEEHTSTSYCYCNFRFGWHTFTLFPFDAERLKKENYISMMSLIRREHFIGFDESLKRFQDWDLWKRMLDKGYKGIWYPEYLFSAPMKKGGISKDSLKDVIKIIKRKLGFVNKL